MTSNYSDSVRDKIIESAKLIFGRYGFRKSTMDDIAQAAGRGKTSMYYYFKSKDEIFQAVVDEEADKLKNAILKAIGKHNDFEGKFRAYMIQRMKTLGTLAGFYEAIRLDIIAHLSFINDARRSFDIIEKGILVDILTEGETKGQVRCEKPEVTANTIVTMLRGLEIQFFAFPAETDINLLLNDLIHLFLNGLKQTSDQPKGKE